MSVEFQICQAPLASISTSPSTSSTATPSTSATSLTASSTSTVPLPTIVPASPIGHELRNLTAPYLSQTAILGETPSRSVDVPITCVFLVLFIVGAIVNMTLFRRNKAQGHLFLPSFLLYAFCMARILSCALRIAWACNPDNASLSIAAFIFVSAGIVIIFVVNLVFAQRIVRAIQPAIGWSTAMHKFFVIVYALTAALLITTVVTIVHSHYTFDLEKLSTDRDIQLGAMTYFLFLAFLPILLVYISHVLPRMRKPVKFGTGSWKGKVRVLVAGAVLTTFGAGFRTGSQFMDPRRPDNPAWYHSKVCFYLFNLTVEVLVVYLYLFTRVDQRFYVPNGSRADGDYSRKSSPGNSAGSSTINVVEKRRSSCSSYARAFDGTSSIYSWGDKKEEKEVKHPEHDQEEDEAVSVESWSYYMADAHSIADSGSWDSESTLQLPQRVAPSRMRVVTMDEAPFVDITFSHADGHAREEDWFCTRPWSRGGSVPLD